MLLSMIAAALAGDLRVDMLDVGQGDSILIRTPANKIILIDAAESKAHVSDQLKAQGVDHLDLVIATHPHADHIGGMQTVLQSYSGHLTEWVDLPRIIGLFRQQIINAENKFLWIAFSVL